jgi:hypothetical protein
VTSLRAELNEAVGREKPHFSHLMKGVCFALQSSNATTYRLLRKLNIFLLPAPSTLHEAFGGQVRELMGQFTNTE